jgi:hypothetical protein
MKLFLAVRPRSGNHASGTSQTAPRSHRIGEPLLLKSERVAENRMCAGMGTPLRCVGALRVKYFPPLFCSARKEVPNNGKSIGARSRLRGRRCYPLPSAVAGLTFLVDLDYSTRYCIHTGLKNSPASR